MAKFIIARGNKRTGTNGLMGVLRIDNEVKPRQRVNEVSKLFRTRIAAHAASFSVVEARDLDDLIAKYGPEI